MIDLRFEWNEAKAKANLRAHDVSFESATTVFDDVLAIERLDIRENYGEERFVITGRARDGQVLVIVFTEREDRIRIISARRGTQREQDDYFRQDS